MQTVDTKQYTEQLESLFIGPARAYAALTVDYSEKLINAQLEAGKSWADANLAQLRSLLTVKSAEDLRIYMEGQQNVAKELAERLKRDADKVVALQQDFVQQSQKLTEESVQKGQKLAESGVKQVTESASKAAKRA
ncbi:phasin family protein [Halomonas campisalis]|uniref:Phasin family protein n=1 Tax=Billgrantia campisalis TaxID=74661 RepID=A0ABS9PAF9_9GAMM|nr:phasin family protein [Halomonas campisalis]MCG6658469.1 phasin family protein [Halomonas campisalis]MDR5863329.1 phasin family protein [Halomonas campisalis]